MTKDEVQVTIAAKVLFNNHDKIFKSGLNLRRNKTKRKEESPLQGGLSS
jgi:hypothetical protein